MGFDIVLVVFRVPRRVQHICSVSRKVERHYRNRHIFLFWRHRACFILCGIYQNRNILRYITAGRNKVFGSGAALPERFLFFFFVCYRE